jgi:hypothetical protein
LLYALAAGILWWGLTDTVEFTFPEIIRTVKCLMFDLGHNYMNSVRVTDGYRRVQFAVHVMKRLVHRRVAYCY